MRIAAAAWPLDWHADATSYAAKLDRWISGTQADLLVFPEYAGIEASLTARPPADTPEDWLTHAAAAAGPALDVHRTLARSHGKHILMGSLPVAEAGRFVNRAYLIAPDGSYVWNDKQIPTPWERRHTTLASGDPLLVSDTAWGRIGVLICHDGEFPELSAALDCDILLIPACTDGPHGAARVRNAARARALEGCCITVLSQTVGPLSDCCFLDENHGRAGIYGPPDRGFPPTGILNESLPNTPGWAEAEVPLAQLRRLRDGQGEVHLPLDRPAAIARAGLGRSADISG
ncbi:nitrilase-related carbon-nitrogen hydrolase [Palleronia caenipelagi]|uniref:nitrilase-related carbon-nitrogen hydrolase n=1 Tax=Palleronia caenipelagi TaxID=2489174 RepID=UPI00163D88A5|nr:nitrilase-related carbon-nitrogen hydrolase [Palleronia caenipelagi]